MGDLEPAILAIVSKLGGGDATVANQILILDDIGDFSAQVNLQSLLDALGVPDVAAKPLYTCLVTDRLDHGTYGLSALQMELEDILHEQADTPITITAILASETDVFDLNVADTRYIVRSLRLKSADPGANNITVRLRELINDVSIIVDTFTITTANFGTYHSLMDMFGVPHLAGDDIQVTVQASAAGPYAITGQYSHAKAD